MLTQKGHGCDEHITSLGHNWNCVRIRTRALQVKNIAFYSELIFFEIISWLATNNKNYFHILEHVNVKKNWGGTSGGGLPQ